MNQKVNWETEAQTAANRIGKDMISAHRGVLPWRELGISVVFGNDAYSAEDGRAAREVAEVRDRLTTAGIRELGFAVDEEEAYTWAMIVQTGDVAFLTTAVWEAWNLANGDEAGELDAFRVVQQGVAATTILDNIDPAPRTSLN